MLVWILGGVTAVAVATLLVWRHRRARKRDGHFWCAVSPVRHPGCADMEWTMQWTPGDARWVDRVLVVRRGRVVSRLERYPVRVMMLDTLFVCSARIGRRWRSVVVAEALLASGALLLLAVRPEARAQLLGSCATPCADIVERDGNRRPL